MEDSLAIIVFSPYYPPHIGGLENHAQQFTAHMEQRGHRIAVYTPQIPKSASSYEMLSERVEIFRFPAFEIIEGYPFPKFWTPVFWRQLAVMNKRSYSIVCSRTRFFVTSIMAWAYARATHKVFIHIEHGSDFVQTSQVSIRLFSKLYDFTLGVFVLLHADAVVANSKASSGFVRMLTHNRVSSHIIYRGVEEDQIIHAKAAFLNAQEKTVITYVGRLMPGKGIADLLLALIPLKELPIVCYIVGDGPQKEELQIFCRKHELEEIVQFLGGKNHDDAMSIIKGADIIINPSYTEGLPTLVIEAALCKKAIIATSVGGTPEIIKDGESGLLVPPHNISALSSAIREMTEHSEKRKRFGESAYKTVRGTFSWSTAVHAYEELFRQVHS